MASTREMLGEGQVTVAYVESRNVSFTPQQFEQLLRSFQIKNVAADDDFAVGIACLGTQLELLELLEDWIYDTRATDHMKPIDKDILDPYIQDLETKRVTGLGKLKYCLYHLLNVPADKVDQVFSSLVKAVVHKFSLSVVGSLNSPNKTNNDAYALWHHRLGHVSDSKLKHMKDFPVVMSKSHSAECLSCPMAKFSKLPYAQSDSHSTKVVELIHIDIWGPYKVATTDKYRYFLKLVYDCSRANWTYLLVHKSDSFLALRAFIKFVHTQFNKSVKVVRSDNALEFVKELWDTCNNMVIFQKDLANFKGWCLGMDSELRALEKNGTWDLIELPPGKKAIGSHWIFKTKLKADATVEKRKPELLCKGIHRQETFALVAKMVTIGSLLAVAALKGWDTCQMDVSNAFLHGDLLEEVYMRVPLGYAGKGESVNVDSQLDKSLVCKLKKSLYGLKQAPRQWFSMLSSPLFFFGFVQSKTDYSLFVKKDNQKFIVVLVYVDDLLFTGNDKPKIQLLKSQLSSTSHMNDLGDLSYFLGLDVSKYVGSPLADPEKSKKQAVVSRSSAEAEYRAMALTCCEYKSSTANVSTVEDFPLLDEDKHYSESKACYGYISEIWLGLIMYKAPCAIKGVLSLLGDSTKPFPEEQANDELVKVFCKEEGSTCGFTCSKVHAGNEKKIYRADKKKTILLWQIMVSYPTKSFPLIAMSSSSSDNENLEGGLEVVRVCFYFSYDVTDTKTSI
ncbi:retrovirus-related pol polyprotein from transposon TNT 1-94 [Tanacetum coccineum]